MVLHDVLLKALVGVLLRRADERYISLHARKAFHERLWPGYFPRLFLLVRELYCFCVFVFQCALQPLVLPCALHGRMLDLTDRCQLRLEFDLWLFAHNTSGAI